MKNLLNIIKSNCCTYSSIVLFISLFFALSTNAQEQSTKKAEEPEEKVLWMHNQPIKKTPMIFPGIRSEIKGNHDTYVFLDQSGGFTVFNKKNTLMHTYSSWMQNRQMKYISFDKPLLDSYVEKQFSPVFGRKSGPFIKDSYFHVSLYSDIDGNIKELLISYTSEINIPCTAIEKFEESVLNGELKLIFDKNRWGFKDATWVNIELHYPGEDLRKQGQEKKE